MEYTELKFYGIKINPGIQNGGNYNIGKLNVDNIENINESNIYIKKSTVEGIGDGVFANKDFKKDDIVEICNFLKIKLDVARNNILFDYVFSYDKDHHAVVLGNGMLYNHSKNNNITYKFNDKRTKLVFTAKRDIKKGEELLDNYGSHWFNLRQKEYKGV